MMTQMMPVMNDAELTPLKANWHCRQFFLP